jgi:arylsulfatase A-like enzyme
MTEKALGFIEKNKSKAFFLYLPYTIPHLSLQAPAEYVQKYIGQFDEQPYYGDKGYAPNKYPLSTYAAMISFLDAQVGIIMQKIKALGLDENTIIMFSSDNGATFSAGVDTKFFNSVSGFRGLKMEVYEGGIRVPFIARWPGKIKENTTSDLLSVQYDIMPTLADLTGKPLKDMDGVSILPTLLSKQVPQTKHEFMYFEYPENGGQIALRLGNWKGVQMNVRKNPTGNWELYDIGKDPFEKNNVALANPTIITEMKLIAKQQHMHPQVLDWEFIDPKIKKANTN